MLVEMPPQSTSVSKPFCAPSLQLCGPQVPAEQVPEAQSASAMQFWNGGQGEQSGPPQSTLVSPVSSMSFMQEAGTHFCIEQYPDAQSLFGPPGVGPLALHEPPGGQGGQVPPQSTSVSVPLLTPSLQPEPAHVPELQIPLSQSGPMAQSWPGVHVEQSGPPQSTSVSVPSTMPFLQTGSERQVPLEQYEPDWQSVWVTHLPRRPHPVQSGPPQSTSVSPPFCAPSPQVSIWQVPLQE